MEKSRYIMVFRHDSFAKRLCFEGPAGSGAEFASLSGQVAYEAGEYPSAEQALAFIEEKMRLAGFERQAL